VYSSILNVTRPIYNGILNTYAIYWTNNEEDIVVFYLLKSIFREKNKEIFIILLRRWFEYINLHFNLLLRVYLV